MRPKLLVALLLIVDLAGSSGCAVAVTCRDVQFRRLWAFDVEEAPVIVGPSAFSSQRWRVIPPRRLPVGTAPAVPAWIGMPYAAPPCGAAQVFAVPGPELLPPPCPAEKKKEQPSLTEHKG
jgi:hypothetical protein